MSEILEGAKAPDFNLPTDGGGRLELSDLVGKAVVVYFYPKDDTSGCTKEAVAFTESASEFEAAGAVVVGISPDLAKSHDKFKAKHDLGIVLADDEDKSVIDAYGVWVEKSMYGRKYMGVERATFLVDRDGTVARVWRKVKVTGHAKAVHNAVTALQSLIVNKPKSLS